MLRLFGLLTFLHLTRRYSECFSWSKTPPAPVTLGAPANLSWTFNLSPEEKKRADVFSLIIWEQEKYLYSDEWLVLAIKQPIVHISRVVRKDKAVTVFDDKSASLMLGNITVTDLTRFRCTFFSSFAAPKSIIQLSIPDEPVRVRIVDGPSQAQGRVELYRNGFWGTICSDSWDVLDATVVCRMLGYKGAWSVTAPAQYGQGSGPVWLDRLACKGSEASILECPHGDWGKTKCDHSKDAGLLCSGTPTQKPPTQPRPKSSVQPQPKLSTHTVGAPTLQPRPTSSVRYQAVSSIPLQPTSRNSFSASVVQPTPALVRSSTQGTQSTVRDVSPSLSSATSASVTVIPQGSMRIVGPAESFGRVEIYYNDTWGTVCDDFWDLKNTKVVCRALGFQYAWTMLSYGKYLKDNNVDADFYGKGPIWLDDVNCTGNENSLSECHHRGWLAHNCYHNEDAGVYCGNTPKPSDTPTFVIPSPSVKPQKGVQVRLAQGSSSWDGRVEIYYEGAWGTVCDDDWDVRDAHVICRMLGSPGAAYPNCSWCPEGSSSQRVLLDEVWCSGQERSIAECSLLGWGIHNCEHSEDVGIVCRPPPPKIDVRLRNPIGGYVSRGLVEVYYRGSWGTVCDNNWDNQDGEVVCRMLGYPGVLAVGTLGGGAGAILLDQVNCTGNEQSLVECRHNGWGKHSCTHDQDAGVVCDNTAVVQAKDAGCNFDTWFCRWENSLDDKFDWTRETDGTPSAETGPSKDHTSGAGHFLYLEASSWDRGDNAILVSPQISSSGPLCMTFYYHMYGKNIGTLQVVLNQTVLWQLSGEQGNRWYKATVPLRSTGVFQVNIVGDIGTSVFGDIAIDDIDFVETANCTYGAESVVPPAILSISTNQTVQVGSSVVLSCVVHGKPLPRVIWKKNGVVLQSSTKDTNYTISSTHLSDNGAYECSAVSSAGAASRTTYLTVVDKPRGTTLASNVSNHAAIEGETVAITCSARGVPVPNCRLSHDAVRLNMTAPLTYVIRNFSVQYVGTYRCNCSNTVGSEKTAMELSLYVAPVIHTLDPSVQSFNETQSLTIYCNASGNPAANITWEKVGDNSKVFPPGELLHIQRTQRDDAGAYRCTASNGRGFIVTDTAVANLQFYSPLIDQSPLNLVVNSSSNVTLYCNATGKPNPAIRWTKAGDNQVLATGETLVIVNAGRLNRGSYICTATNGIGSPVSDSAYLEVQYKPFSTTLEVDKVNAIIRGNERFTMKCKTEAVPAASRFHFYRNGVYLETSSSGQYVVHKAVVSDAGTYKCAPENLIGFGSNATIVINIIGPLSIISFPKNQTVIEGQSVSFYCNATSFGANAANLKPHITWTKVGDQSSTFPSGETLLFTNVSRDNAGRYQCQADNGLGFPDTATAVLHVLFKPANTKLVSSAPDNNVLLNMSVVITCSANAKPAISHYKIYHAGVLVSNSTSGTYNISRVTPGYNGTFTCIPMNPLGEGSSATVTLIIISPCGRRIIQPSGFAPQIVGGIAALTGTWPWQVQIARELGSGTYKHICGGAVLSNQWIVTAAHCVSENQANLTITLGEHELGVDDGTEQVIDIKTIIVHPDYNYATITFDIALIKLARPMLYNDNVGPICLPSSNFSDNTMCYVTGWGGFASGSAMSDKLQEASIPLYSHAKCVEDYKDLNKVTDHMICAGTPNKNVGTCKGDSGGPLTCEDRGRWFLVGITSWGRGGCADNGSPGVYSDVFYFKGWIEGTMRNNTR